MFIRLEELEVMCIQYLQLQQQIMLSVCLRKSERSMKDIAEGSSTGVFSHSFSGNLRSRRRSCASSCSPSMRSCPSDSGVLCKKLWVHLIQQVGCSG
ncbi:hypothetical protein SADUNF_Sadunf08G0122000 [Salix dunnii]|uniref:Uncharacterized protein n=1 Tax=Salix dunnii TaxID=1413687 RepID=A0A835K088_9ROSI|nr:hypothetical protein SADUNF_Sadunf08G0122000 [Salix dunnii]